MRIHADKATASPPSGREHHYLGLETMDSDLGIVNVLEWLGLQGFALFVAAAGVSIAILLIADLLASRPFPERKRRAK